MVSMSTIIDLVEQAARKWIRVRRAIAEPTVDSQGEEALRITLVLDPQAIEHITGDHALDVLFEINEALQSAGDDRLPIISYATEEEVGAGALA